MLLPMPQLPDTQSQIQTRANADAAARDPNRPRPDRAGDAALAARHAEIGTAARRIRHAGGSLDGTRQFFWVDAFRLRQLEAELRGAADLLFRGSDDIWSVTDHCTNAFR
jgi:hypothetical protein